ARVALCLNAADVRLSGDRHVLRTRRRRPWGRGRHDPHAATRRRTVDTAGAVANRDPRALEPGAALDVDPAVGLYRVVRGLAARARRGTERSRARVRARRAVARRAPDAHHVAAPASEGTG